MEPTKRIFPFAYATFACHDHQESLCDLCLLWRTVTGLGAGRSTLCEFCSEILNGPPNLKKKMCYVGKCMSYFLALIFYFFSDYHTDSSFQSKKFTPNLYASRIPIILRAVSAFVIRVIL